MPWSRFRINSASPSFEPPYRTAEAPLPARYIETLDELNAVGDLAQMLRYFQVEAVGMPEEMAMQFEQSPDYQRVLAMAPTLAYDARCCGEGDAGLPTDMLAAIDLPVLALCSTGTLIPWLHDNAGRVAAALDHGTARELVGDFHDAPADAVAESLASFYRQAAP